MEQQNGQTPQGTPQGNGEPQVTPPNPQDPQVTPAEPTPTAPPQPQGPVTPPVVPPQEPDYKEKFRNSSRENQILLGQQKNLNERLESLTKDEIPTEEEMKRLHPNWDYYSDTEKELALSNVSLQRSLNKTNLTVANFVADQRWQTQLAEVVSQNPVLKGREGEFRDFVFKEKNRGVDMSILVSAFIGEHRQEIVEDDAPPAPPTPTQNQPVLESGGAGGPEPARTELSYEDREKLRKSDPKKYNELIRKGVIKS